MSTMNDMIQARLARCEHQSFIMRICKLIEWYQLEKILNEAKQSTRQNPQGKKGYNSLSLFKAVLLGQWYQLSDHELENALVTRLDFLIFCGFNFCQIPDHSTLCRMRNWLADQTLMPKLLKNINKQLESQGLKADYSKESIIDSTIIESRGKAKKKSSGISKRTTGFHASQCG